MPAGFERGRRVTAGRAGRLEWSSMAADEPAARERYLTRDTARLYVREIGRGEPIIVLHGGPDFDHEYLLPDMDRLAESLPPRLLRPARPRSIVLRPTGGRGRPRG